LTLVEIRSIALDILPSITSSSASLIVPKLNVDASSVPGGSVPPRALDSSANHSIHPHPLYYRHRLTVPTSMTPSIHERGTLDRIIRKYMEKRGSTLRGGWGSTRL